MLEKSRKANNLQTSLDFWGYIVPYLEHVKKGNGHADNQDAGDLLYTLSMSPTHDVTGNHSKSWRKRGVMLFISVGPPRHSNLLWDLTSKLLHRLLGKQIMYQK